MKASFLLGFIFLLGVSACSQNVEKQLTESREATKQLGSHLKQKLSQSMQANGPIEAMDVCNIEAEGIAANISNNLGLEVGRTSLKLRNVKNASDDWENEILHYFEQQKQSGAEIKNLEIYEVTKDQDGKWFRYMKAIPTSEVCLICHGETIAQPIQEKLHTLYPDDQATGFNIGDIRGAFTVKLKM